MSGTVDDYTLIKLVESHPILYDKDLARGHRNATMKDKAWKELSIKLQASERACITRWKSIRDRFGKEFRRVQENPDEPTNWDMFPHLLFLRHHYKQGNALNDTVIEVKYEPKERKRKIRTRWGDAAMDKDEEQADELDPEELMTNQQLIGLVKDHPVLYDKQKIRDSKNLILKNYAWNQISKSLGISEEICYKRWKRLRDRFAREYRHHAILPDKPVTWVYFHDLMFLEGHYRKGVPLQVENLKRKPKELCNTTSNVTISSMNSNSVDSAWGNDYSYVCAEETEEEGEEIEELVPEADIEETYIDVDTQNLEELLMISPEKKLKSDEIITDVMRVSEASINSNATATIIEEISTETKLCNVISDMEKILKQSQDCLKTLQEENQRCRQELEVANQNQNPDTLEKIRILLNGLDPERQSKAERKMLKFLCECQIKVLNNEEIEDVNSLNAPFF